VQPNALTFQRKLFLWQGRIKSGNLAEFRRRAYLIYENVTGTNGMPEHAPTLRNIWRRCQRNSYDATLPWKRPRVVEMGGSFHHLVGMLSPKPPPRVIFKIISFIWQQTASCSFQGKARLENLNVNHLAPEFYI